MIRFILMYLTTSYGMFSTDASICEVISVKKIPPPNVDFKATNNDSLVVNSCGPPGTPAIEYSCTPRIVTSQTKWIEVNMSAMLTADLAGGSADLSIYLYPGSDPIRYSGSFDCSTFPPEIHCPFPLREKDWISASAVCRPRTNLPIGTFKLKASITNYDDQTAICVEGSGHIYPNQFTVDSRTSSVGKSVKIRNTRTRNGKKFSPRVMKHKLY